MAVEFWLAQLLGLGAAIMGIGAYQLRGDKTLIYGLAGAAGLWALHFLLLGSLTAALTNAITLCRNLLAAHLPLGRFGYGFVAGYLIFGMATWETAWDVLPTIAVCIGSIAMFFMSGLWRRGGLMVGGLLWMIFNIKLGSIPGILVMGAEAISNGVFIARALRQQKLSG